MCIYSVRFLYMVWRSERVVGAGWLVGMGFAIYTRVLAGFASDSEKAGPHASCRIYLSYMSFFFVGGDLWPERLHLLLLSLLSGRRCRSGALSSYQGLILFLVGSGIRLVVVELDISIAAERALSDELSLFPQDVFDCDARV